MATPCRAAGRVSTCTFLPAPTPASAQEPWIQIDAENDRGGDNRRCKLAFEIGQKYTNGPESAASANKMSGCTAQISLL